MPSSQHWLLVIPACQAGRFSLQPLAVGCRSDFPKLEHGLTKAKGGLSGREGGQSVSLSPLEAVAQILAQVTKESESDALLPPQQPGQQMCCMPHSSHIPAEDVHAGAPLPRNLARLTVSWLQIASAKASSTRGCEGEGRLGNISPFFSLSLLIFLLQSKWTS